MLGSAKHFIYGDLSKHWLKAFKQRTRGRPSKSKETADSLVGNYEFQRLRWKPGKSFSCDANDITSGDILKINVLIFYLQSVILGAQISSSSRKFFHHVLITIQYDKNKKRTCSIHSLQSTGLHEADAKPGHRQQEFTVPDLHRVS